MFRKLAAAFGFMLLVSPPLAAQTLVVEGVVSPAWIERSGAREPLVAGAVLRDKDKIHTGAGARALLRMAEGSAVKLGENAVLAVDDLLEKKGAEQPLVSAALEVVRGAFRFTTGIFGKQRAERDVKIRISTVTAGIRGTDVWGKSESERDIVCLVEGKITVEHGGQQFIMQDALSFFIAPRKEKPQPVAPVSKKQLDQWIEETEIRKGSGAMRKGARDGVDVVSTRDHNAAAQSRNKLRASGFPAEIETLRDSYGNEEEYRVRIGGLAGAKDAQALAAKLKASGFPETKVAR
jgi:hypothetical protein